ncbi:MAG: RNA methyltransferase [Bacteroidia bacterium]
MVIVLDNVRSALNVGSIFRTADTFLIEAVYLCGITAQPPHREILKTALGATQNVRWKYFKDCEEAIAELRTTGYKIICAEQTAHSEKLHEFMPNRNEKHAVIFGNEISGIDQRIINLTDVCIEIPQHGLKHSLNIAVCAGIVIWDLFVKLNYEIHPAMDNNNS